MSHHLLMIMIARAGVIYSDEFKYNSGGLLIEQRHTIRKHSLYTSI
jgi:hypothetical protein